MGRALATKDAACRGSVQSFSRVARKFFQTRMKWQRRTSNVTREFLERVAAFYPRSIFLDLFEPTRRSANFIVPMFDLRQSNRLRLIRLGASYAPLVPFLPLDRSSNAWREQGAAGSPHSGAALCLFRRCRHSHLRGMSGAKVSN